MEAAVNLRGMISVADDIQALRMAMELERRAINMLKSMTGYFSDPAIVELLNKMTKEECDQYDVLQAQFDSLQNVGLWLDKPEFRMDGRF
jgi:rubrerythrin